VAAFVDKKDKEVSPKAGTKASPKKKTVSSDGEVVLVENVQSLKYFAFVRILLHLLLMAKMTSRNLELKENLLCSVC
jgi:hypothetical protein